MTPDTDHTTDIDEQFDTLERLSSCTAVLAVTRTEQERLILEALTQGLSLRTVAAAAGVTAPTIAKIRDQDRFGD